MRGLPSVRLQRSSESCEAFRIANDYPLARAFHNILSFPRTQDPTDRKKCRASVFREIAAAHRKGDLDPVGDRRPGLIYQPKQSTGHPLFDVLRGLLDHTIMCLGQSVSHSFVRFKRKSRMISHKLAQKGHRPCKGEAFGGRLRGRWIMRLTDCSCYSDQFASGNVPHDDLLAIRRDPAHAYVAIEHKKKGARGLAFREDLSPYVMALRCRLGKDVANAVSVDQAEGWQISQKAWIEQWE